MIALLRRISSLLILAIALFKTLALRLWPRRPSLVRFAEHYQSEGIVAVTAEEAAILVRAGRCFACGLCDQTALDAGDRDDAALPRTTNAPGPSIMGFVLAGTRSLPDYDASAFDLSALPEGRLREAEKVCPRQVPIVELAHLVRSYEARVAPRNGCDRPRPRASVLSELSTDRSGGAGGQSSKRDGSSGGDQLQIR